MTPKNFARYYLELVLISGSQQCSFHQMKRFVPEMREAFYEYDSGNLQSVKSHLKRAMKIAKISIPLEGF